MLRASTRLVAATISAGALALAAAGVAGAAPVVTPGGPYTTGQTVDVHGTVPGGLGTTATHFAVAECNTANPNPALWSRRCNHTAGSFTPGLKALTGSSYADSIRVHETFADFDFSGATTPTTTTNCDATAGTDPCAVLVSFYHWTNNGIPQFAGQDYVLIGF